MVNYDNFAITLGRAVEVFRRGQDAVPEQKVALRALTALSRLTDIALEVGVGELRVGGMKVPPALPGISVLQSQLEGHDVAELRIRRGAAAASLLELLRGLAAPLGLRRPDVDLARRLHGAGIEDVTVTLLRPSAPRTAPPDVPVPAASVPAPRAPAPPVPERDATTEAMAVDAALRGAGRLSRPEAAVAAVVLDPDAPGASAHLDTAAVRIREELEHGRASGAVRALAQLIQLEGNTPAGEAQQALTHVIETLLTDAALRGAMDCAAAAGMRDAALRILRRGGGAATAMLRARLVTEGDEEVQRRTLDLLREQPEGLRSLILLLQHGDRAVIQRAALLLGSLGVQEAVPALSRVVHHDDPTVRAAATTALGRLATPQAVELLGELFDGADAEGVTVVADALSGPRVALLVPRLANAARRARNPRTVMALGHALGRIGTPEALDILARWVAPPGWRFWRRGGPARLAAVDGLRIAGGPDAVRILERLSRDTDPAVRRAALEAVEDLAIAAPGRGP